MKHFARVFMVGCLLIATLAGRAQRHTVYEGGQFSSKLHYGDTNRGNGKIINIDFDANSKAFRLANPPAYVGEGGSINIIIRNFNPFLYSLTIRERQGVYQNKEMLGEKNFSLANVNQANINLKDLSFDMKGISTPDIAYQPDIKKQNDEIDKLTKDLDNKNIQLIAENNKLKLRKAQLKSNPDSLDWQGFYTDSLNMDTNIQKFLLDREKIIKQIEGKKRERDNAVTRSKFISDQLLLYNNKLNDFVSSVFILNNIPEYYKTLWVTNTSSGLDYQEIIKRKEANFRDKFPGWQNTPNVNISNYLNSLLHLATQSFIDLQSYYNLIHGKLEKSEDTNENEYAEQLKDNFAAIKASFEKVNMESLHGLIDNIDRMYLSLNDNLFSITYSTNIIDDDADVVNFDIEASPTANSDPNIPSQRIPLSFSIPIFGGVKIDVGTGLTFNFGPYNKSYRYEETSTGSGKYRVIENSNKSLFSPAVVLMAHLYRRNAMKNHRPGIVIGIGTSDAERLRYYLGLGWRIGRKQWMNFCAGIVGGQVDMASESVLEKELSLTSEDLTKPIPMRDPAPFRAGAFFAVTFSLTGNNSIFSQKLAGK
jgi:hypothetical protein